jgi:hypothetical protein
MHLCKKMEKMRLIETVLRMRGENDGGGELN